MFAATATFGNRSKVRRTIEELDQARFLPTERRTARAVDTCQYPMHTEAPAIDPVSNVVSRVMHKLWCSIMRYDLERDCAFTAFVWGIWVIALQPISASTVVPSVRGLRLCNEIFAAIPIPSDMVWGVMTAIPALLQMLWMKDMTNLRGRSIAMVVQASAFLCFTLLLAMENPRTTGIPMYAALALAQLVCLAHLSHKRYCGPHE